MTQEEQHRQIENILDLLSNNPHSSALITYRYTDASEVSGVLPSWRSVPDAEKQIASLIRGSMNLGVKRPSSVRCVLDREEPALWQINRHYHPGFAESNQIMEGQVVGPCLRAEAEEKAMNAGYGYYSLVRLNRPLHVTVHFIPIQ